jgi:pimeloyl-ACP methyl ester carboxylesterase
MVSSHSKVVFKVPWIFLMMFFLNPWMQARHARSKTRSSVVRQLMEQVPCTGAAGAACSISSHVPLVPSATYPVHVNNYGDIVESYITSSQGPLIEKILIYPKESAGTKKRIIRSALLTRYKNAEATILICHGFMCDKFDAGLIRSLFPRGKFNFMTFDFRGHGDLTDGQCCTLGYDEKYDVIAAARFLREHSSVKNKPLIVYGFSMGAVAAIEAQAKNNDLFDAMILDCPFESTENVLKRSLDNVKISIFGYEFSLPGKSLLQRYAFHPYVQSTVKIMLKAIAHWDPKKIDVVAHPISPVNSVHKIDVPCFYILCKRDEKVSIDAIKSIFSGTASTYKQLWITNGRRHFDSFFYNPERYSDHIRQFVRQFLDGSTSRVVKNEILQDADDESVTDTKSANGAS